MIYYRRSAAYLGISTLGHSHTQISFKHTLTSLFVRKMLSLQKFKPHLGRSSFQSKLPSFLSSPSTSICSLTKPPRLSKSRQAIEIRRDFGTTIPTRKEYPYLSLSVSAQMIGIKMPDNPTLLKPPPLDPTKSAIENVLELTELAAIGDVCPCSPFLADSLRKY